MRELNENLLRAIVFSAVFQFDPLSHKIDSVDRVRLQDEIVKVAKHHNILSNRDLREG